MSRPCKCRRVCCMPGVTYFKPAGVPMRMLEENCLTIEELEAIRLRDIDRLEQIQCAQKMHISRPTFQRVLISARSKIADSLLSGKALRIEGGNYELNMSENSQTQNCMQGVQSITNNLSEKGEGEVAMKIAVITDDGVTVSQHFGMAPWYMVFNIENGKIMGKEKRAKMGHQHFSAQEDPHQNPGMQHGMDPASHDRHASMADAISDCQVLIAGGMGQGAFNSLKIFKIEPIITDVKDIEQAVKLQIEGKLPNLMGRLH